jgi:transcriptional regulator GlxA family with amidase domain
MNYIRTEFTQIPVEPRLAEAGQPPCGPQAGPSRRSLHPYQGATPIEASARPCLPARQPSAASGLAPWQLLRVRQHVEATLSDVIRVATLAQITRLSASHFTRAFKVSSGITPAAYVVSRRLERAKTMMLDTAEPLCRISLDCGFTDQSHLSRAFRRQVGQSPSLWRRWNRLE